MSDYRDKVVLITGAGCGFGAALAKAFAAQGAFVAINDLTPVNVDQVAAEINTSGGQAKVYLGDVAKKVALQTMLNELLEDKARIDVLVNHASVQPRTALLEIDEWDWRRTVDVNLNAVFLTMQSVGRIMRELGGGVILNMGAVRAESSDIPGRTAYLSSKAGVAALTRAAAVELAEFNVRVNCVTLESDLTKDGLEQILKLCDPASGKQAGEIISIGA